MIILASSSPRRKALLTALYGDRFQVIPSTYQEDNKKKMDPLALAREHATGKAREVARRVGEGIVIGVDTFVSLDGEVLGKPIDSADARRMLRKQSGRVLTVISGICVIDSSTGREEVRTVETEVTVAELREEDIEAYINTGEPMGKAGSFGVQGRGALFVESIRGDYFNVVGLPVFTLHTMLKTFGIDAFASPIKSRKDIQDEYPD